MKMLSGLYYPFSRCINISSLKQMLLTLDSVHFVEPVVDENWRAWLFRELEYQEDDRFSSYRSLLEPFHELQQQGVIKLVTPNEIKNIFAPSVTASALSDLIDPEWIQSASSPSKFGLPHRSLADDGRPTWQIFQEKMPVEFITALGDHTELQKHMIFPGNANQSWTLSYPAGSAISISVHLAAAEELSLAPITDSAMHHKLLIHKVLRQRFGDETRSRPMPEDAAQILAHQAAIALVKELIPEQMLEQVTFDEIIKFRDHTQEIRRRFVEELESKFSLLSRSPDVEDLILSQREIQDKLSKDLHTYQLELTNAKARIWPGLFSSLSVGLPSGSLVGAAVGFSVLGSSPGYVLCGSIIATALGFLKSALDVKTEMDKTKRSASPGVSYLSTLSNSMSR